MIMRIGLIGYGSIGERHARLLRRHARHIVVLSQRKDVPRFFTTVHDWKAFASSGPFDALFITNETGMRRDTVRRALACSPRALFIEKPLAMNARDAAAIIRAVRRHKISAWVGYCLQWHEPLLRAKRTIEQGTLGAVRVMNVFVGQDLRTWRTRDYRKTYSSNAARGGGVLLDLIHEINYPAWLLGEPLRPIAAVSARSRKLRMNAEALAESTCVTPSGVVVQIHQDCLHTPGLRSLDMAGTRGTFSWRSDTGAITVTTGNRSRTTRLHPPHDQMYERQLTAFFRMLRSGKPFSNLDEAQQDLRVVDAIRKRAAHVVK